jgi:hypothetical protein
VPLTKETGARVYDACIKLREDMSQAKYDAAMAAIRVRHAFFEEMEALGIEGYVGLMRAINSEDPRADCALTNYTWK